jgi:mRNA-degrading endonuclease toxin of MazEF toxin-antitoxin module
VSAAHLPQLGSVVWAELDDPNGFRKVRPAVVVTPTVDIATGRPVRVLAVTTRLPSPLSEDHVLLPWDPQGKARSGLRRKCAAVTTWQGVIALADVQQIVGLLPPAVIDELLAKLQAAIPAPGVGGSEASTVDPRGHTSPLPGEGDGP